MNTTTLRASALAILLMWSGWTMACTNFLVTRGASADGSNLITYAADSHLLYGELYFWAAQDYPSGSFEDIYEWDTGKYLGKIPQARHTYTVVGNMNEHQLAIAETTFGGRKELRNPEGIMDYGSLIYVTLKRAKNAREAIKVMTTLVEKHGYYSSGESFSIMDENEVWILEMIGKGKGKKGTLWVAMKVPDGYISGHANQARITNFEMQEENKWDDSRATVFHAKDVVSFARDKGWFSGKDEKFSFSDTYAPVDFGGARFCDARVWAGFMKVNKDMQKYEDYALGENLKNRMPLWIKPEKKVSLEQVMDMMRDHYEGTALDMTKDVGAGAYKVPYRWRPLTWEVEGKEYFNERAIATQQTGFVFVAQSRKGLPSEIGGILWWGVDDAATTVFNPIYCGSTRPPETVKVGNGNLMQWSDNSAFWAFNQVSNYAYTRYSAMYPEIRKVQKELEHGFMAQVPVIDKLALAMYKKDPKAAREFITDYSVRTTDNTTYRWKELYQYLFMRYMDGNIKEPKAGQRDPAMKQPGYSPEFYKNIVKDAGDRLKSKEEKKSH